MLTAAHYLLLAVYAVLPAAGIALTIIHWRKHRSREPLKNLVGVAISSLILGGVLVTIFAVATHSRPRAGQIALTSWYFAALLIVLKMLDRGLKRAIAPLANQATPTRRRKIVVSTLRIALLASVALPLIMSAIMTFRPKVALSGDPSTEFGWPSQDIYFTTRDGQVISGW